MAAVVFGGKHVAFTGACSSILAFDILCGVKTRLQMPTLSTEQRKKEFENEADQVLAATFSSSGKFFAATDDHKSLAVWSTDESWKLIYTKILPRRITAMTFDSSESNIFVADKSGDVYCYSLFSENEAKKVDDLVMGHVSMLLDLKLCGNDKFLVTCDRDEKIRVSHFPNAYSIQSFCLGHSDFVSCLLYLENVDLLASGSGDGTVKLWNYREGIELFSVDCFDHLTEDDCSSVSKIHLTRCESTSATESCCRGVDVKNLAYSKQMKLIAVAFERLFVILIFKLRIEDNKAHLSLVHKLFGSGVIWDLCFDDCQNLLVLQESEGAMFVPYSMQFVDDVLQVSKLVNDVTGTKLLEVVDQVNQENEFYKCSVILQRQSKFPALHKVRIDNMAEYISRKHDRLHQEEQKARDRRMDCTPSELPDKELPDDEMPCEENRTKKVRMSKK